MTENELLQLWQSTQQKVEGHLAINKENTEAITKLKMDNMFSSMKPMKIMAVIVGILWGLVLFGIGFELLLSTTIEDKVFFLVSIFMVGLSTAVSIAVYLYQLVWLYKTDYSGSVQVIQRKISNLKMSTFLAARILFLQLPFWTVFYWDSLPPLEGHLLLWIGQGAVTILFIMLSIWLFININFENRNRKWFRFIFRGPEWQPILLSMELLRELENGQGIKKADC